MIILGLHGGVSQLQNEASASLVIDGNVIAACEEERFSRQKGAFGLLPIESIRNCLKIAGITMSDVDLIAHTGTTHSDLPHRIKRYMNHHFGCCPELRIIEHQLAHLASAYYQSGYKSATCISYDGYGDNVSVAVGKADCGEIEILRRDGIDSSLGRFYSAITSFLGFSPQESEYKVMGLAPYGKNLIDISEIISIGSEQDYTIDSTFFAGYGKSSSEGQDNISSRFEPWYSQKLVELLGEPRRSSNIEQFYKDLAFSAQKVFEDAVKAIVVSAVQETGIKNVALAGGCALNCKANMEISSLPDVEDLFVQPAASDRGLSLGSALAVYNMVSDRSMYEPIRVQNICLGTEYSDDEIMSVLTNCGHKYEKVSNVASRAADDIVGGKIIGWFQGRSEFGPRALGSRSILVDPTRSDAKQMVNARVKYREEFRPFAPSVCEEKASIYFECDGPSPFMTRAMRVRNEWRDVLKATTHIDGTARVQTVNSMNNPLYYSLIQHIGELNGVFAVLNTSFNVMGEPIVETPRNAIATFSSSGIDCLYIGSYRLEKQNG